MGFAKLIVVVGFFLVATRLVFSENDTCICTMELKPVCGTNNQTYGNPCQLECYNKNNPKQCNISIAHNGTCSDGCFCSFIWKPVCGSDNQTYGNDCDLYCSAVEDGQPCLKVAYDGECTNTNATTTK